MTNWRAPPFVFADRSRTTGALPPYSPHRVLEGLMCIWFLASLSLRLSYSTIAKMTTLAIHPSALTSSCPFSSAAVPSRAQCPFNSPSVKAAARTRRPAPPRAPTDLPDLRKTPSADLLYLPPLLSLLPASIPPSTPSISDAQSVGYTTSRLPTVDAASIALHHALHSFRPTTPNYAYDDYPDAFKFHEIELPVEMEREW